MTPLIHVRPARRSDVDAIIRYNMAIAQETEDKLLDADTLRAGVLAALDRPDECRYFVAEMDGRVVGQTMITYEWTDWRNGRIWWLQSVYVDAEYRRCGVFRALFEHIQNAARQDELARGIRLYVEADNTRAQQTYQGMGMQLTTYRVMETDWSTAITRSK